MVPDLAVGLVRAAPWLTSVTLTAITYIKSRTARQGIQAAQAILERRRGGLHIGFQQFKGSAFAVTVTEPGTEAHNTMPIACVPGAHAARCAEPASPDPDADPEPDPEFGEEFAAFYGHAYPWAISRLRSLTGLDLGAAHDAVQDAFIACRRHWATLEPLAPRSRRAYLLTAATRIVRDRHPRDGVVRPWDPAAGLGDLATAGPEHEVILRQEVFQALKNLPERQREIVLRRHYADLTVEQIATQMGLAQRTVRTHLNRAHRQLSDLLSAVRPASTAHNPKRSTL
jgi:RNA polymerase sigma factor (sigma-70 family)